MIKLYCFEPDYKDIYNHTVGSTHVDVQKQPWHGVEHFYLGKVLFLPVAVMPNPLLRLTSLEHQWSRSTEPAIMTDLQEIWSP